MVSTTQLKHLHALMTIVWFVMMPISFYMHWITSIAFVSVISLYANFVGHFSSWQASRTELKQDEAPSIRTEP